MNSPTHPVEQEEVMAYLDGELPVEHASAVAAHLKECAECSALSEELRTVSQQMMAWQVKPSPARLAEGVTNALKEHPEGSRPPGDKSALFTWPSRSRPLVRRWVVGLAIGFAVSIVFVALLIPNLLRSRMAAPGGGRLTRVDFSPYLGQPESASKDQFVNRAGRGSGGYPILDQEASPSESQPPSGPMIVRTASLALVTKEFDRTRAAIEVLVRQHHGYNAQLTVAGEAGAARSMQATFRVPTDQLDIVLMEAKKLARVERESQSGEEVTQQYVDLVARLSNARHTEQRLIDVLRERTGKVADILAVEQEIARVREQIERMQAESKSLENRVSFATLEVQLREDYKAQLEATPPSTGILLWNATVEGYRGAVNGALGMALILLRIGPSVIFWVLLLFWPARLAWRRLRP